MTFREKMIELLVGCGCWPAEATAIMDVAEADKDDPQSEGGDPLVSMRGRWNDQVEDYPPQMIVVTWMLVRMLAVRYLTESKPKHFAIPILKAEWWS